MANIYYKNDFELAIKLQDINKQPIAVPTWPFDVVLKVGSKYYICSSRVGNAKVDEANNQIICYVDNHGFGTGRMTAQYVEHALDANFGDNDKHMVAQIAVDLTLTNNPSDSGVRADATVVPQYVIFDAWQIAVAKGYTGTQEQFYNALKNLPQSVKDAQDSAKDARDIVALIEGKLERGEFDGFSPTVEVMKEGKVARITITDRQGNHVFLISDGSDADVTAANIKRALGYTPADAADLESLEETVEANDFKQTQSLVNARNEIDEELGNKVDKENFSAEQQTRNAQYAQIMGTKANREELDNYTPLSAFNAEKDLRDEQYSTLDDAVTSAESNINALRNSKAERSELSSLEAVVVANDAKQQQLVIDTANGLMTEIDKKANKTDLTSYAKKNDSSQTITANTTSVVTMKAEEVWLGDNEDVLTTENGILTLNGEPIKGGGGGGDAYTKAESDAKFAKLDNTSQTISVAQILLGKDKYDMWTDDDGYLWVNGEKYVSEGNEATHLVAEKVTAPQVNTDAVWFSENEDVLDVQGGKLKLNGESVSEEEVYIGSGTPPTEAKIAIDPSEDLVEIVQEVGTSTSAVMSQKAVTDLIGNVEQLLASI